MMELMLRAGFSKLHPDGKYSTKKLLKLLNIDSKKRVLDIGCGPGETTIYIAKKFGCQVTGVDMLPGMVERAKESAVREGVASLVEFRVGDAQNLPFEAHR